FGQPLDTEALVRRLREHGTPAFCIQGVDEIIRHLLTELKEGDVVAIMSNGGFGGIHERLLAALRGGTE
ncbi:hypothetical protein WAI88_21440, partial [Acinetobacter baumannii]